MKSCMRWTIPDNSFIKHAMNLSWERLRKKNLSKLCQAKWPVCFFGRVYFQMYFRIFSLLSVRRQPPIEMHFMGHNWRAGNLLV